MTGYRSLTLLTRRYMPLTVQTEWVFLPAVCISLKRFRIAIGIQPLNASYVTSVMRVEC